MNEECSNTEANTSGGTTEDDLVLVRGLGDRGNVLAARVNGRIGLNLMSADGEANTTVHLTPSEALDIAQNLEQLAGTLVEAVSA